MEWKERIESDIENNAYNIQVILAILESKFEMSIEDMLNKATEETMRANGNTTRAREIEE